MCVTGRRGADPDPFMRGGKFMLMALEREGKT